MEVIRKQRNVYAVFSTVGVFLTAVFYAKYMLGAAIFGFASIILILLLVKKSFHLYYARLIWDNRIIAVQSALISMPNRQVKKYTEETVVSTFGILIGSEIYRWGLDGVHGVRLHTAQIDQERMYLTFGDAAQTMRLELLHGMTQKQAVLNATQKLLHETGVTANITGW